MLGLTVPRLALSLVSKLAVKTGLPLRLELQLQADFSRPAASKACRPWTRPARRAHWARGREAGL